MAECTKALTGSAAKGLMNICLSPVSVSERLWRCEYQHVNYRHSTNCLCWQTTANSATCHYRVVSSLPPPRSPTTTTTFPRRPRRVSRQFRFRFRPPPAAGLNDRGAESVKFVSWGRWAGEPVRRSVACTRCTVSETRHTDRLTSHNQPALLYNQQERKYAVWETSPARTT